MARCKSAKITGVAGYVPPRLLTNADLEKLVDTNDEWIVARTGIRTRRIVEPDQASSDLAVPAAEAALRLGDALARFAGRVRLLVGRAANRLPRRSQPA